MEERSRSAQKFLTVQHNENMAGHGFAPNLWEKQGGASGKEPACQFRRCKKRGFNLWVGKIPWRREWQPTLVFLPRESHGQRSLVSTGLQSIGSVGDDKSVSMHAHRFI